VRLRTLGRLAGLALGVNAYAEDGDRPAAPPFKTIRYEEDYRYLKDPSARHGFLDEVKYIDLPVPADAYLSLGGEWRERYQNIGGYEFGLSEFRNDDYLLQRLLLHADLHWSRYFRAFVQFGSHYAFGKANQKTPVEEDRFDLQQGFAEARFPAGRDTWSIRGGRQELSFGSERLVSVRNNPNIRRSFDAVRAGFRSDGLAVDAFYAVPLALRPGVFDDRDDEGQSFWGIYAVLDQPFFREGPNLDVYYLGLDRADSAYTQGVDHEHRHSLGVRAWRKLPAWDYNFEAVYQFGSFGRDGLSAWTVASDTGYRWNGLPFKPRLALKLDVISGDDNPEDRTLETFNPLFPKLAYFSENALVVPANLFNVYPYLNLELMENVELTVGWDWFWRYSTRDAFYINPFRPLEGTAQSRQRHIGSELTLDMSWQFNRHIQFSAAYVHLFAGGVLRSIAARDVDFFMLTGSYRF
jgi:hypothetical protein